METHSCRDGRTTYHPPTTKILLSCGTAVVRASSVERSLFVVHRQTEELRGGASVDIAWVGLKTRGRIVASAPLFPGTR